MKLFSLLAILVPTLLVGSERFFVDAEALWWHASSQETLVAYEKERKSCTQSCCEGFLFEKVKGSTSLHGQPEKWYWGYRLGVGYRPPCYSCWDWKIEWTQFEPTTRNREEARPLRKHGKVHQRDRKVKGDLVPHTGLPLLNDMILSDFCFNLSSDGDPLDSVIHCIDAEEVAGYLKIKWNILDFSAGSGFCLGDCVHFRPFAAVRYAYIDQCHKIQSKGAIRALANHCREDLEERPLGHFLHNEVFRNKFQGVGPTLGFDTEWKLGCCWGIFGNLSAALMYGDTRESDRAKGFRFHGFREGEHEDEPPFQEEIDRKSHGGRALTDLKLGIFFRQNSPCYPYSLTIKLGWEHHYFFNPALSTSSYSNALICSSGNVYSYTNHDLSVQGATLFLGIDF